MLKRIKLWAWDLALRVVFASFFRQTYSPKRLRKNFQILAGQSQKAIRRRRKNVRFTNLERNGLKLEEITTSQDLRGTVLYLHGGGYVFGSVHAYRNFLVRIAHRLKLRVIAPEYRQAPEHPFPAALVDAESAHAHCVQTHPDSPLFLGGDSAGGGLTLALLLKLRDGQVALPRAAFFFSPFFDHILSGKSWIENRAKEVWLTRDHVETWSAMYRGEHPKDHSRISPLLADLNGLCPMLLFSGENEVLLDDARLVAQKAKASGVDATFSLGKQMQHDWPLTGPFLVESKATMKDLADFITRVSVPNIVS